MKCFVINLEQAIGRRKLITEQFCALGVDFVFSKAKFKDDLTEDDFQYFDARKARFLSTENPYFKGHFACWISHFKVWRIAINNGFDIIAVFEDDAILGPEIKNTISSLEQMQDKFDIVFLNNQHPDRHFHSVMEVSKKVELGLIRYATAGSYGYVITKKAMNRLLNDFQVFNMAVDQLLQATWIHKLVTYYVKPTLVFHPKERGHHYSYIAGDGYKSEIPVRTIKQKLDYKLNISIPKRLTYYRRIIQMQAGQF